VRAIAVVAGLICNARGEYLLAQRPRGKAHAGLWEFPGGKIEAGEDAHAALVRELKEELDLTVTATKAFKVYPHRDTAEQVELTLRVLRVVHWSGTPIGLEGQAYRWVSPALIHRLSMPAADRPAARDLGLGATYLITPEPPPPTATSTARRSWLAAFERSLVGGHKLVLLRAKQTPMAALRTIAVLARDIARHHGAELLLQDDPVLCQTWRFGGISLTASALARCKKRPLPPEFWLAASCHNQAELQHAAHIGCDFATLSPVLPTRSHPGAPHLGWAKLSACLAGCDLPVYALGGLSAGDLATATQSGAWGIAGISGFWQAPKTLAMKI
jgi:8-oxo-dGTP diphosphatase